MFKFYKIAIFVSFIIVLASGCSNKEVVVKPNPVCISDYNSVLIEGRVGIKVQDNFTSGNFELKFVEDYFKLTINGPLNMGTKIIEVGPFGLKVDNISINLSFNNWMEGKHGWYFPIAEIKNIALKLPHSLNAWSVQTMKTHNGNLWHCSYPRSVRLSHKTKDVKIKLVLKEPSSF
jgi:outer membrane biogenesis lipoprotein LolB